MSAQNNPEKKAWVSEGWVQITHMMGTIAVVVTLLANVVQTTNYINKIESRVSVLESREAAQRERDDRQDRLTAEAIGLLRNDLQYLRQGLDRLLERDNRQRGNP